MVAGGAGAQQTLPRRHSRLTVAHDSGPADAFCPCLPVFQRAPFASKKGDRRASFLRRVSHTDIGCPPPFPARATNTYTLSHVWASPGHGTQGLAEGLGKQNFLEPTAHLVPLPRISSSASRKPSLAYTLAQDARVS